MSVVSTGDLACGGTAVETDKYLYLLARASDADNSPKGMFGKGGVLCVLRKKYVFLNYWCKTQEVQHLGHAGTGEAFAAGDGGSAFDLTCVELALPLLGQAQEPDGAGATAPPKRLGIL